VIRLLIVTTVHPADDPRIRQKYVRTLAGEFDVTFAAKGPPPVEVDGFRWRELRGRRVRRWFRALRLMMTCGADVAAIHDPELIPAGLILRAVRRTPVVFDLHENLPAVAYTRGSIPRPLRPLTALAARFALSLADRFLVVTAAEAGYQTLVRRPLPVFPNFPDSGTLPPLAAEPRTGVIYVGDVTEQRGAPTLLEAVALADVGPLVFAGRCRSDLRRRLLERAEALDVDVSIRGWMPHDEAMQLVGASRVGVSPLHDLPNYRDSLPTKTLEYLAMGTPVIASDLPGTREVIDGLPGVRLVPAGSVEALAEALASVDETLIAAAVDGATDVRVRFRWPADDVRAFYRSLVAG